MKAEIGKCIDDLGHEVGTFYFTSGEHNPHDGATDEKGNPYVVGAEMLRRITNDEETIEHHGYHLPCNHKDCPPGTTMWDHVLHHASTCREMEPEIYKAVGSPRRPLGVPIPAAGKTANIS